MASSDDYAKYFYATGCRSIRRAASKLAGDPSIDADLRGSVMKDLAEAQQANRTALVVGQRQPDPIEDEGDEGDDVVVIDTAVYSDGSPVFTIVDWSDGYATLVHHPDSMRSDPDSEPLQSEMCPCCGGMPQSAGSGDENDPATQPG